MSCYISWVSERACVWMQIHLHLSKIKEWCKRDGNRGTRKNLFKSPISPRILWERGHRKVICWVQSEMEPDGTRWNQPPDPLPISGVSGWKSVSDSLWVLDFTMSGLRNRHSWYPGAGHRTQVIVLKQNLEELRWLFRLTAHQCLVPGAGNQHMCTKKRN